MRTLLGADTPGASLLPIESSRNWILPVNPRNC